MARLKKLAVAVCLVQFLITIGVPLMQFFLVSGGRLKLTAVRCFASRLSTMRKCFCAHQLLLNVPATQPACCSTCQVFNSSIQHMHILLVTGVSALVAAALVRVSATCASQHTSFAAVRSATSCEALSTTHTPSCRVTHVLRALMTHSEAHLSTWQCALATRGVHCRAWQVRWHGAQPCPRCMSWQPSCWQR